jgi:hypothetical protein
MSRAAKIAARQAARERWLEARQPSPPPREKWKLIGFAAKRPPDAPGREPVACTRCDWTSQRYRQMYFHPRGQPDEIFPWDLEERPCPRCGSQVSWTTT